MCTVMGKTRLYPFKWIALMLWWIQLFPTRRVQRLPITCAFKIMLQGTFAKNRSAKWNWFLNDISTHGSLPRHCFSLALILSELLCFFIPSHRLITNNIWRPHTSRLCLIDCSGVICSWPVTIHYDGDAYNGTHTLHVLTTLWMTSIRDVKIA